MAFGRTIQLFLVDGDPDGLTIASIHGWTGLIEIAPRQSAFSRLLSRKEIDRTGIYVLYGPDPDESGRARAYIGEADNVKERIAQSAGNHGFWEKAVVIITSDEALNKGHVRFLEARLIALARQAGRATLANNQLPDVGRRRLAEADEANMEAFLANIQTILPVIGLDLLQPRPKLIAADRPTSTVQEPPTPAAADEHPNFEIRHRSGVHATAAEDDGEFIVFAGSQALKEAGYSFNAYARLKEELISKGILCPTPDGERYEFREPYSFSSPSAAGSVVLDRNTNGRTHWFAVGTDLNYHQWQEKMAGISIQADASIEGADES